MVMMPIPTGAQPAGERQRIPHIGSRPDGAIGASVVQVLERCTFRQIVDQLRSLDSELTIYSADAPFSRPDSVALLAYGPEGGGLPDGVDGLQYLLEVSLAQEVLHVWRSWRHGR